MKPAEEKIIRAYLDPESETHQDRIASYRAGHPIAQKWKDATVKGKVDAFFKRKDVRAALAKASQSEPPEEEEGETKEPPSPIDPSISLSNLKHEAFCHEYLIDKNMTQSAIRAGYSKKTAGAQGFEIFKKPEIRSRIAYLHQEQLTRVDISADRILQQLARIAFSDVRDIFRNGNLLNIEDLDDLTATGVAGVEVVSRPGGKDADGNTVVEHVHKIRLVDKVRPLEALGRNMKLFTEKVEHTGADGGAIKVQEITVEMSPEEASQIYKESLGNSW